MKLSEYGGRMVWTDDIPTVELHDEKRVFQYRRTDDGGLERRVLMPGGIPYPDGSPWKPVSDSELRLMRIVRGQYHPVLDPLGL